MAVYYFEEDYEELQDIVDLSKNKLATPYDTATNYAIGDYCVKGSGFYRCIAATTGDFDASKWQEMTIGDALKDTASDISALADIAYVEKPTAINGISSDTDILTWDSGTYYITLDASSNYLPTRWGTLHIFRAGNYISALYITTNSTFYYRTGTASSSWRSGWKLLTDFSSLSPTAPTAVESRVMDINDGYIKVGRLVFVSCYFVLNQNVSTSGTQVVEGFPLPVGTRNLQAMNLDTNAVLYAYVATNGRIGIGQASSGNRICVEGVYFARS